MAVVALEARAEVQSWAPEVDKDLYLVTYRDTVWVEIQVVMVFAEWTDPSGYCDGDWASVTLDAAWEHLWSVVAYDPGRT